MIAAVFAFLCFRAFRYESRGELKSKRKLLIGWRLLLIEQNGIQLTQLVVIRLCTRANALMEVIRHEIRFRELGNCGKFYYYTQFASTIKASN